MIKGKETEDRRSFELSTGEKFFIAGPTAEDIRLSDWLYSKTYNRALVEGIATASEMEEALRKRGILGPEYDEKLSKVKDTIGKKIVDMELSSDKKERKELAEEVSLLREELFVLNQRINGPMSNSIENMSEDARLECLTSCLVQKEDGSRVWASYDEYLTEDNSDLSFKARFETMLFLQGLEPDFLEKTPERIVLKEISDDESKPSLVEEEHEEGPAEEPAAPKPKAKVKAAKKPRTPRKRKSAE